MYNCEGCQNKDCRYRVIECYMDIIESQAMNCMLFSVVDDLIDGIELVLNIRSKNKMHEKYIEIDKMNEYSIKMADKIVEMCKNKYVSWCYVELSHLLYKKYGRLINNKMQMKNIKYKNSSVYFIHVLLFLYGRPYKDLNYLKYRMGLDNRNLYMYWEIYHGRMNRINIYYYYLKKINETNRKSSITKERIINKDKLRQYQQEINQECSTKEYTIEYTQRNSKTQNTIKEKLIDIYKSCVVCGIQERKILEYAHIKPYKYCSEKEILQIANGILLCLHHHKLFDSNMISFEDDGTIIISEDICKEDRDKLFLDKNKKLKILEESIPFLQERRRLSNRIKE